ncbi:MAG: hypothetical protein J6331_06395 [Lentisphaeria bacterium]|nr:hypothetical protein [Lentisphaeria bacterium]
MTKIRWKVGVSALEGPEIVREAVAEASEQGTLKLGENVFSFAFENGKEEGVCSFAAGSSSLASGRFFLAAELPSFRKEWFILIPSACYDGNRFRMEKIKVYPPRFLTHVFPEDPKNTEVVMKEVPSLGNDFDRRITDASAPLVGVFMPERKEAFFLALEQGTVLGDNGIELLVTEDGSLRILLSLPCGRRKEFTCCFHVDTAPELKSGQKIQLRFQTHCLPAADMKAFYKHFAFLRNRFPAQGPLRNTRSFSHAEEIIRKMFEEVRWIEKCRFYTKARGQERIDVGWTTYPELAALFHEGTPSARKHVLDQLDNLFSHAPLPGGFFLPLARTEEGKVVWSTDGGDGRQLARQQHEILFFSLRLFLLFHREGVEFPEQWKKSIRKLAETICSLWEKEHQFGYLLDLASSSVTVGRSFAGALGPAALAFASEYFREPRFLRTAEEAAESFCRELHEKGYTYGGAGDALFTPDSESAFSLLESLVILFETTKKTQWLEEAEFCADYCSSWVPAVKYKYPENTLFARWDIDCRGAVQANLQNQHGAPGICIGSGNALFRLFRYTGHARHLEMLREIAHNCVQYLSTEKHPIPIARKGTFVLPGDICEKVYFQDYVDFTGEIPFGTSGWTEIAVLLSVTENPGVYCDLAEGTLWVLDHVEGTLEGSLLTLSNPFDYPVAVRIFADREKPVCSGPVFLPALEYEKVSLAPRGKVSIDLADPKV